MPPRFPQTAVIIPAAGSGQRMGGQVGGQPANKVLLPLAGQPILWHTVSRFLQDSTIHQVQLVAREQDFAGIEQALQGEVFDAARAAGRLLPLVVGGKERQDSVWQGLQALMAKDEPPEWVLVHDAARPLLSAQLLRLVLTELHSHPVVVPTLPVVDTVRQQTEESVQLVDRSKLHRMQTPQAFQASALVAAAQAAQQNGFLGTDDVELTHQQGLAVRMIPGENRNIKITTPDDMALAEWMLANPTWGTAS